MDTDKINEAVGFDEPIALARMLRLKRREIGVCGFARRITSMWTATEKFVVNATKILRSARAC